MKQDKKGTVLVVDDDPASLSILFNLLRQANFKVLIAEDGASTLKRVKRLQSDIILLDIMIPDINDFELCRRLKGSINTADTPVIFLSILSETADKVRALEMNAVDYITKPFQPEEVIARVEKHLTIHNLQKKLEDQNRRLQQEITERQRVETELREAHDQLKATLNALPDILFEVDGYGRVYGFHAPRLEALYMPPQEFLGKTVSQTLPQEAASIIIDTIGEAVKTGRHVGAVYSLEIGTDVRWYELSVVTKGDAEAADARLVALVRDITQSKQAEAALLESEEKYRNLIDLSPDPVVILQDGCYQLVNQAFIELFGYTQQDVDNGLNFFELVQAHDKEAVRCQYENRLAGKQVPKTYHIDLVAKDGTLIPCETAATLISYEGHAADLVIIMRDITERKRAKDALQQQFPV